MASQDKPSGEYLIKNKNKYKNQMISTGVKYIDLGYKFIIISRIIFGLFLYLFMNLSHEDVMD